MTNEYKLFIRKTKGKRKLGKLRDKGEDNIKMDVN
jgi:hypothetical protein